MSFINLLDLKIKEIVPGSKVQFVHSENMTTAYWTLQPGSALPSHSHPHEQVSTIIEGEFELTINDETRILRPGIVAVISPNAIHFGKALTHCRIIDVFHPTRDDYR